MQNYLTIVSIHIVFAGIWLIFFAADIILKRQIENSEDKKNRV